MSTSPLTLDHIVISKIRGKRILDVGCGYGKWGFLTKKYFWNTQNGSLIEQPFVAGLDIHPANVKTVAEHRIYDQLLEGNATSLPFEDKSFDTVLGLEIIEHMKEEDGHQALKEFERVAEKCIILSTPNKKCFRDGVHDMNGYNPYEAHVSAWKIKTFEALGYRCYGIGMKLWPSWLWGRTEFTYFSYRIPFISDMLLCVKLLSR